MSGQARWNFLGSSVAGLVDNVLSARRGWVGRARPVRHGASDDRWVVLADARLGAALLALGVAAVAEFARLAWQRIGLRLVASWLAASALLVLGLQWAGPLPKDGQSKASSITAPAPISTPAPN